MDRLVYWIWLSLSCTPDSPTFARLLESFDTAEEIYNAEEFEIRSAVGSKVSDCSALLNKNLERAKEIYEFCTKKGVGILTYEDEEFPQSLRDIPTPPVLLYYRGRLPDFNNTYRCAVVGTRSLSHYGRINAFKIGYDMASVGAIIVSGMAKGIDGVALAAALSADMPTIAVLGSGIDVCYPTQHLKLARMIVRNGCIFTEYPPGTKPERHNFPRRNRIISGLSDITVVVEGNENSGALITARYAKKQGREVYAFPGNVDNIGSQATNMLIQGGAKLCTGAHDILNDYGIRAPSLLNMFKLKDKPEVNMMEVLKEYEIDFVTPSDDIFKTPRVKKQKENADEKAADEKMTGASETEPQNDPAALPNFNKEQLALYKKIPMSGECTIESLIDDNCDLKKVMSLLLKLEMGRFVILLPGDKVKRNM